MSPCFLLIFNIWFVLKLLCFYSRETKTLQDKRLHHRACHITASNLWSVCDCLSVIGSYLTVYSL